MTSTFCLLTSTPVLPVVDPWVGALKFFFYHEKLIKAIGDANSREDGFSWAGRSYTVKLSMLPKVVKRLIISLSKLTMTFFKK